MIAINVTEFRGNMKKYLKIAESEKVIIHNAKGKAYAIVPVEEVEEKPFNASSVLSPEQNKAIDEALEDVRNGRVYSHENAMETLKSRHPKYFQ